jgi:hypothetical protein
MQGQHDSTIDQMRRFEQEIARQSGQITALEKALSEVSAAAPDKRRKSQATKSGRGKSAQGSSRPSKRSPKTRPDK